MEGDWMLVEAPPTLAPRPMTEAEMAGIKGLMWPRDATEDDLARWHQQGFVFPPNGYVRMRCIHPSTRVGTHSSIRPSPPPPPPPPPIHSSTHPPAHPPKPNSSLSFGLAQGQGGPCGVLAAVQGEIVRLLVFDQEKEEKEKEEEEEKGLPSPSPTELPGVLAQALVNVLVRALPTQREVEEEDGGGRRGE